MNTETKDKLHSKLSTCMEKVSSKVTKLCRLQSELKELEVELDGDIAETKECIEELKKLDGKIGFFVKTIVDGGLCKVCDGSGEYEQSAGSHSIFRKCDACSGSGVIVDEKHNSA